MQGPENKWLSLKLNDSEFITKSLSHYVQLSAFKPLISFAELLAVLKSSFNFLLMVKQCFFVQIALNRNINLRWTRNFSRIQTMAGNGLFYKGILYADCRVFFWWYFTAVRIHVYYYEFIVKGDTFFTTNRLLQQDLMGMHTLDLIYCMWVHSLLAGTSAWIIRWQLFLLVIFLGCLGVSPWVIILPEE